MARRVLFVTHEMLPLDGGPASGGGLRVWGLARGLEARGFEVEISMPRAYLEQRRDVPPALLAASYEQRHLGTLVERVAPDVVVLEQPRSLLWFEQIDVPVVIDLPGPLYLEDSYQHAGTQEEVLDKIHSLSYGDLFLVSHERQRSYFLSWLALAGVDLTADRVRVVPLCLPPDGAPERRPAAEPLLIYAGYFHTWQDPAPALAELVGLLERRGAGHLELIGGRHPADLYGEGRYLDPRGLLPASERIVYREPLPWPELCEALSRGWIGLDLLRPNIERSNAFPIREVNYLWCGLPPLVSPTSPLAAELLTCGAGWVVGDDPAALTRLVDELLDDPARIESAAMAARALARRRYSWDVCIEPLAAFCADPSPRRGKGTSFLPAATDRQTLVELAGELGRVAAAQQATQQELDRRNAEFEETTTRLVSGQEELHRELQRASDELERASAELAAAREAQTELARLRARDAHREEVLRRLTGDHEQQRRRAVGREGELARIRRSPAFRLYVKLRRLAGPAALVAGLLVLLLGLVWAAPSLVAPLVALQRQHPAGFGLTAALLALAALLLLYRLRRRLPQGWGFRWRWLSPTRSRWLGAIKLVVLFLLSLILMVYLKVWERIHRIRVFP